jgi:hypothetical protein
MTAEVLLDQRVFVTYSQAWVYSGTELFDGDYDPEIMWRGQANGLCGAAQSGVLCLVTGTHTGDVAFRIERYPSEPPVADEWEEVVEVSFSPASDEVVFAGLDLERQYPLDLPGGRYRVRYCVRGMEHADNTDEPAEAYLLQFWPGELGPDRILRQSSERAAYWHRAHRPLTPDEQAEEDRREAQARAAQERERWGDRIPNERLRAVNGSNAHSMAELDVDLEFALAEADDTTHRAVAAWAVLQALQQAGLLGLPAIAPAVAALRRSEPVPPPFDDPGAVWSILHRSAVVHTKRARPASRRLRAVPAELGDHHPVPLGWTGFVDRGTRHPRRAGLRPRPRWLPTSIRRSTGRFSPARHVAWPESLRGRGYDPNRSATQGLPPG